MGQFARDWSFTSTLGDQLLLCCQTPYHRIRRFLDLFEFPMLI